MSESVESGEESRPLRSDAKLSRQALLTAARELFAERGPEALTVVAVAKRAGLNRSTAYQHFHNRQELAQAVAGAFAEEVYDVLREPRSFGEHMDFFVHYFRNRPDIARLWMFQLLTEKDMAAAGWDTYVGSLDRLANSPKSQAGVDPEMLGVIGMASALVWSLMARQRSDSEADVQAETERFAKELKRLFLFGAPRPEPWPEMASQLE